MAEILTFPSDINYEETMCELGQITLELLAAPKGALLNSKLIHKDTLEPIAPSRLIREAALELLSVSSALHKLEAERMAE